MTQCLAQSKGLGNHTCHDTHVLLSAGNSISWQGAGPCWQSSAPSADWGAPFPGGQGRWKGAGHGVEWGARDGGPLHASRHDGTWDGARHGADGTRDALYAARLSPWHAARHAHGRRCDPCSLLMTWLGNGLFNFPWKIITAVTSFVLIRVRILPSPYCSVL